MVDPVLKLRRERDITIAKLDQAIDLLREAEGLLCDPQGGPVGVQLAERIRAYFTVSGGENA